ncbi:MAG: hypothetical protein HFI88_05550 [Lachnospiraceae bacterium]|nr:hypothetical protein [Lachnospiraceae bacterium]
MKFNPNEVVFEKIRYIETFDPTTKQLISRLTNVKEPTLNFTSEGTQVTDAQGAEIVTFYNAAQGTLSYTNAIHSFDLLAEQFSSDKNVASEDKKIVAPVSEILEITDSKVTLKYVPVGTAGAEIKYVQLINDENEFGETLEVSATIAEGKFTINAEDRTLTFHSGTTGRVIVDYEAEMSEAISLTKTTDSMPPVRTLHVHCYFRNKCDNNIKYIGVISFPRAQIDISSVDVGLTPDGGHAVSYKLQKPYCDETGQLCSVFVYKD